MNNDKIKQKSEQIVQKLCNGMQIEDLNKQEIKILEKCYGIDWKNVVSKKKYQWIAGRIINGQ